MRHFVCAGLALILAAAAAAQEIHLPRLRAIAERFSASYNAKDFGAIRDDFGMEVAKALPREQSDAFFRSMMQDHGKILKLEPPRPQPPRGAVFLARFEKGSLDLKLHLDEQGKVGGIWFLAPAPDIPVPERNRTRLSLPAQGRWKVIWGGDTREQNQHREVRDQRFAFDLVGIGEDGKTRKGKGADNEDFYAFGREIMAPAEGVVTDVIEGVRDNRPGSMNPGSAVGNAVFIEHRPDEISLLAHFKQGSIRVKPGQKVARGETLGLCGNSGNSSEPHIHYHLQNAHIPQDATGIRVFFDGLELERDGVRVSTSDYSPVKDDVIEPQ